MNDADNGFKALTRSLPAFRSLKQFRVSKAQGSLHAPNTSLAMSRSISASNPKLLATATKSVKL